MLVDSVIGHPHSVRGKISRAGFTVGVIEKQAVSYRAEGVAGQNPVRDLVMNFLRVHVPHVLRVVFRRLLRPPRILSISPKVLWLYKANNHRL